MIRLMLRNILISAVLLGALGACSTSPEPRLYIIEPLAAAANTQVDKGITITVGPITLPEHLDHKGIVTRDQRYRINSAKFDRWAEPLDHNITRVMCENLTLLVPSDHVIAYPLRTAHDPDFSVQVRIVEFASNPDGQVVLNAAWVIRDATDTPIKLVRTRFSTPRRGDDVVALVEAMSIAIEQLSRDIANAVNAASAESTE